MSLAGAISRTRVLRAAEAPLAMSKWWAKKKPVVGEITMHLASNEQHVIGPWIKTFPKKAADRVITYLWPIGSVTLIYATMEWAEYKDHEEDYHHRF